MIEFSEALKSIDHFEGLNLTIISDEIFFEVNYQTYVEGYQVGYENVPKLLDWKITRNPRERFWVIGIFSRCGRSFAMCAVSIDCMIFVD